jgi:hypothetical protein
MTLLQRVQLATRSKYWLYDQEWYREYKGGEWFCNRFITDFGRECFFWWSKYSASDNYTIDDYERIGGVFTTVISENYEL